MDYKVTCKNCGHQYRLTAEGGQTIWAKCPNCGFQMRVNLPVVSGQSQQSNNNINSGNTNEVGDNASNGVLPPDDKGKKNDGRRTTNILLALIFGILVGGIIWFVWQQKQKNDAQARVELQEERKAHMDSLMALRNQQRAEEEAAQKDQEDQAEVTSFLNQFYGDWLSGGDMSYYANNLSQNCYEKLREYSDIDADSTASEIDWQPLCPSRREPGSSHSIESSSVRISVNRADGNWYRVRFTSSDNTEYRQLEVFPQNGKVIINDFR